MLTKKIEKYEFFITLKNLDYGELTDNLNNYNFRANESIIQFSILKKNKISNKIMLNINYLKSKIDIYQSDAIGLDLLTSFKIRKHHYFNVSFKNSGKVINSYSNTSIKLPAIFNLSYKFIKNTTPISFIIGYIKRTDLKKELTRITLGLKLNNRLNLYLSTRSDKTDLFFGKYIQKLVAGTSAGITYTNNKNNLNLAFQNLCAAGYTTSLSFTKIIL